MLRKIMVVGLLTFGGGLLGVAAPAWASFESLTKSPQGKGNLVEVKLTGGGGTIECQNAEESAGRTNWTIKNEGKEAEKGTALLGKVEEWGKCLTKSGLVKEVPVTLSQCELEVKQLKAEAETALSLVKECTLKAKILGSTCEIKMPVNSNKERQKVNLYDSGKEQENMVVELNLKGITTEVNKACESGGIKASEGTSATGLVALPLLRSSAEGEMVIGASPVYYNSIGRTGTVTVTDTGREQKPQFWARLVYPAGSFTMNRFQEEKCEFKLLYHMSESCTFEIEYVGVGGSLGGWQIYYVSGLDGVIDSVLIW